MNHIMSLTTHAMDVGRINAVLVSVWRTRKTYGVLWTC
jgi:hypothetical protein